MKGTARIGLIAAAMVVAGHWAVAAPEALTGSGARYRAPDALAPLPALAQPPDPQQAALGKLLFFDLRLGGDATIGCVSCHDPDNGWADGLPLSKAYPGALYFRNTPTVINAVHGGYLYWDGRLPASDLPTVVRDHISEAHFLQADGRLIVERLRQIPAYEEGFKEAFGGEPTYGRLLNAVTAFLQTLRSREVPFDRYLGGDGTAISASAQRGLELFRGTANCVQCHDGAMLSDGGFHNLGLATHPDIFATPERHITFRRFFKMLGVSEYATLRDDLGLYAITKQPGDRGRFRTPTLRELVATAPYMHDGSIETLEEVVRFYNDGGGAGPGKDPLLSPLALTPGEIRDLVEFLGTLSGSPIAVDPATVKMPLYELRGPGDE